MYEKKSYKKLKSNIRIRRAQNHIYHVIEKYKEEIKELENKLRDAATEEEKKEIQEKMKNYTDHIELLKPSLSDLKKKIAYSQTELARLQQMGGRKSHCIRKSQRKRKHQLSVSKTRKH